MPPGIERRLVLRLLGHWRQLCADRTMPVVSEIDPAAIPEIWPYCFLLEIDQSNGLHKYRALGDEIDKFTAPSLIGKTVADALADVLPGLALRYVDEVLEKSVPISRGGEFFTSNGGRVLYRSILLPTGDDENGISCILGAANCRELVEN
jgi:hypothetical protein